MAQKSIFDYLSGDQLVEITLKANFDSITLDKFSEDYLEATLQRKGDPKIWELKIKTRGKFRRRICQFPPLKLEFSKKDLETMGLVKFDDLKLVTHCLDDILAQEYVLREYLAYKMYQTLTPYSFRVQLAKITYVNTGRRGFQLKRYGLLIEDEDDLAHRIGGKPQDVFGLSWDKIHPSSAETLAAFQYIVGNTDWDIGMQRNIAFIQSAADNSIISVPYDFDMSGLVNPVYGIPNPDFPIKTLKERYYQGGSRPSAELTNSILSQKENWIALCRNFKLLSSTTRREMENFLVSFFVELEAGVAFTKP
ncbi:MAG: hypothetical protein HC892_21600 [Saprospiraceae bacterium]|nr:hypothetical protein [Saprospiraceae bacterium]